MTISRRDNYSLSCAGLAAGTNAGTFQTTGIVHAQIDGLMYRKAATDNLAFTLFPAVTNPQGASVPTVLTALAANQTGVYFILMNTAGACFVKMQPKALVSIGPGGAGYQAGSVEWPQEDKGYAVIGAIKLTTNASGAFTPGTTALGAANQTATYYNAGPDLGVPIPV